MTRDLRRYTRQTNLRLIAGGLFLLLVVGNGLIYLIYGSGAAMMGLLCSLLGLVPVVLVWLFLLGMEWIVRRSKED